MNNSSLHYKLSLLTIAYTLLLCSAVVYISLNYQLDMPLLSIAVLTMITCVFAIHTIISSKHIEHCLEKIQFVTQEVNRGRFSNRIIHIGRDDKIGRITWDINDILDQLEAYFREINTSFSYVSQGKVFRKPLSMGLHGDLISTMTGIKKYQGAIFEVQVNSSKNTVLNKLNQLNSTNLT